jgi:DNA-binding NarL/FixJ family response regulator
MTGEKDHQTRVLIVSLPGMMQKVLKDTFTLRADVLVVGVASGGLSAANLIQQKQPDLVVIDSNLPALEKNALLVWLKEEQQHATSLVLVETTQQLNQAAGAGADFTLRSYSLPGSLDSILRNLRSSDNKSTR